MFIPDLKSIVDRILTKIRVNDGKPAFVAANDFFRVSRCAYNFNSPLIHYYAACPTRY